MNYLQLDREKWLYWNKSILSLEACAYEKSRRDSLDTIEKIILNSPGTSIMVEHNNSLVGFCLSAPLEHFHDVQGPSQDDELGKSTVLYSADLCISPNYRGMGIAKNLKKKQIELALSLDFKKISGRNRVNFSKTMWQINSSLGAHAKHIIENAYHDSLKPNICIYYHIELN